MEREAICSECGKKFISHVARQFTCSVECANRRANRIDSERRRKYREEKRAARDPLEPIACRECGKMFMPEKQSQRICSAECKKKRRDRKNQDRRKKSLAIQHRCLNCGKLMETKRGNALYICSERCKKLWAIYQGRVVMNIDYIEKNPDIFHTELDDKLKSIHDEGLTYAEKQKQKTLSQVEPVKVPAYLMKRYKR